MTSVLVSTVAANDPRRRRAARHEVQQTVNEGSVCDATLPASGAFCDAVTSPPDSGSGCWGGVEYLLWWRAGEPLPPLVTTSPVGTEKGEAGVLGQTDTTVLFGSDTLEGNARPGARITLGSWLNSRQTFGIEGRFFALGDTSLHYDTSETEFPIIARPFFNALTARQDSLVVAFPSVTTGFLELQSHAGVYGGDVFLRRTAIAHRCGQLDLIAGYQFTRVEGDLVIRSHSTSTAVGGTIPQGTTIELTDLFLTKNEFNAGLIGVIANYGRGSCSWELLAKVGMGTMAQQTAIKGATSITVPNTAPATSPNGLLAQPSNSGVFRDERFLACPEIGVRVRWEATLGVSITAGYSLIYLSDVFQAGDQIDFAVSPTQVPGPAAGEVRPWFPMQETEYWLHGFNLGVTCRF